MLNTDHIAHLPTKIRDMVIHYCGQILSIHGDKVVSITLYGSAAAADFNVKTSDINLAVVFETLDFGIFEKSLKFVAQGRKQRIPAPLFLTEEYILRSLDVFPIEFAGIKDNHKVLFGKDVFTGLEIGIKHLHLFCEAQIKGKILRIRQAYLESNGRPHHVQAILKDSLHALFPVFRQLVRLSGHTPAATKEDLLKQLGTQFSLDVPALKGERQLKDYLLQLENLAKQIDALPPS
jgi:predicted nucleotidyltransferase